MKVTLHVPPGETIRHLMADLRELEPDLQPRTVSGRVGVLVDADLAYRYLARRFGTPVEADSWYRFEGATPAWGRTDALNAALSWANAHPIDPADDGPEVRRLAGEGLVPLPPEAPPTAPEALETLPEPPTAPKATPAKKATPKTKKSEE